MAHTTNSLYVASHDIDDAELRRAVADMILSAQEEANDTFADRDGDVDLAVWEAKADSVLQMLVGDRHTPTAARAWFLAQGFIF